MEDAPINIRANVGDAHRVKRKPAPVGYVVAGFGLFIAIIGVAGRTYINNEYRSAMRQESQEVMQSLHRRSVHSAPEISPATAARVAAARSLFYNMQPIMTTMVVAGSVVAIVGFVVARRAAVRQARQRSEEAE